MLIVNDTKLFDKAKTYRQPDIAGGHTRCVGVFDPERGNLVTVSYCSQVSQNIIEMQENYIKEMMEVSGDSEIHQVN